MPERGFQNYKRNLESLIALAQSHGIKVFVATQALMEWDFASRECADVQVATSNSGQIRYTSAFDTTGKHLFKNDVHPFDEGSELIAKTIADELVKQKLVP